MIFSNVQNSVIINEPAKTLEMTKELLFFLAALFLIEIAHEDKEHGSKGLPLEFATVCSQKPQAYSVFRSFMLVSKAP